MREGRGRRATWLLGAMLAVLADAPQAQDAPAPATATAAASFAFEGVQIDGAEALPGVAWRDLVQPLQGRAIDFATLRALQQAIEARFHAQGWRLVRVRLPAQSIQGGVVRMALQAPVLRALRLDGTDGPAPEAWRARLPALAPDRVPDLGALDGQLSLLNENPSLRAVVAFEPMPGDENGLRAVIRAREGPASGWTTFIDNSGNRATGHLRYGLAWRHTQLWDADHQINVQLLSAPHDPDDPSQLRLQPSPKVRIVGLSYRVPMPAQAAHWDLTLGHSSVDSGTVGGLFDVKGRGDTAALQYTRFLPRWGAWEPRASIALDWRHYDSQVLFGGVNLASPIGLRPLTLGLQLSRPAAPGESTGQSAYLQWSANRAGGRAGAAADFTAARAGADPSYRVLRLGWGLQHALSGALAGWNLSGQVDAQWTDDRLVAAEQFSAGGAGSVRGFASRGIGGDRGLRMQWELTGRDLLEAAGAEASLRPALFIDAAHASTLRPTALERPSSSIASVGVGLRGLWRNLAWRLDLARAVHQRTGATPVWGAVHFSLSAAF